MRSLVVVMPALEDAGNLPGRSLMALPQPPQKRAASLLTNPHDGQFTGCSAGGD